MVRCAGNRFHSCCLWANYGLPRKGEAMNAPEGSYCHVVLWAGEIFAARCVADVFNGDVLTVSRMDDGQVCRQIPAGDWRSATVYGGNGYPIYQHTAKTPTRKIVSREELAAAR